MDPLLTCREELTKKYTVKGKKDKNGNIINGSNLRDVVSNLPDFKEEITLLQYRAEQLGMKIDCSPKFHPEIAGEGIEFCWGAAKNYYRSFSWKEKKTKENWMRLVKQSTCNKTILPIHRIRLFSRRIRCYMLSYLGIEAAKVKQQEENMPNPPGPDLKIPEMNVQLVERLVKVYKSPHKSHRNILDSETKFLSSVVSWMKSEEEIRAVIDSGRR